MNEYRVKVLYGDKKLVDCMEEVIISMIRKYEGEMEKNVYIDKMVEMMKLLNEKHQHYAVKIMEELVKGWLDEE